MLSGRRTVTVWSLRRRCAQAQQGSAYTITWVVAERVGEAEDSSRAARAAAVSDGGARRRPRARVRVYRACTTPAQALVARVMPPICTRD